MTGTCSECGSAFEIKGRRTKTCGPECSVRRGVRHPYRVVTKPADCSECGEPIPGHGVGGKRLTCGPRCATARNARVKAERYAAEKGLRAGMERPCLDCGVDISARRADSIRCATCQDKYRRARNSQQATERWGRLPIDERRRRKLSARLRSIYGIDLAEYEARVVGQDGKCAICDRPPHGRGRTDWLVVDHDHQTGEVRGLLCGNCNSGIGLLAEDPEILAAAIRYLGGLRGA